MVCTQWLLLCCGVPHDNTARCFNIVLTMFQAWHLFEDDHLFDGRILGKYSDAQLLAEMISVLSPPPKSFLEQSEAAFKYWDSEGMWIEVCSCWIFVY